MRQRTAAIVAGAVSVAAVVAVGAYALRSEDFSACPAIGYIEDVEVHFVGHPESVADAQLCDDEGCSPRLQSSPPPSDSGPDPTDGPAPSSAVTGMRQDGSTWDFSFHQDTLPTRVDITAYDSAGHEIALRSAHLTWRRAAPHDRCDLHSITRPITLDIPAARF